MASMDDLALAWLRPADALRRALLRALGPLSAPLMRRRELRVACAGVGLVLLSLATTLWLPLWVLALTPLLYGVPHLVADVRYLVVRPGLHRRPLLWALVGLPLVGAGLGAGVRAGALALCGALLCARGSRLLRGVGIAAALLLFGAALRFPYPVDLVMAHVHNLVAVLLFWGWRRRASGLHLLPIAAFGVAAVLLVSGGLDGVIIAGRGLLRAPAVLDLDYQRWWLAPEIPEPLGMRLVLLFAFAQSVHYAVWTRLIPEEDRARPTPRTFAASLRALRGDLGRWPVRLAGLLFVGLIVWGVRDLAAARIGYFRLALFHGPMELAAAALLFLEGGLPVAAEARGRG